MLLSANVCSRGPRGGTLACWCELAFESRGVGMVATAFVGRAEVLGQLGQALAGAAAGAGCVALVYGEAGIGKTRLCRQVQDEHRGRGGQVLVGRGSPEESAIAYGALADTLRFAAGPSRGCGRRRVPGPGCCG